TTKATSAIAASSTLWTEKWHPTRADDVLGNEQNTRYLRDWLLALELRLDLASDPTLFQHNDGKPYTRTVAASKRPRVIRGVEKPRGRKKRKGGSEGRADWIGAGVKQVRRGKGS